MKCFELGKSMSFFTFTVVSGTRVDVAEWFGYDVKTVQSMTTTTARHLWRYLIRQGYTRNGQGEVNTSFAGHNKLKVVK